MKHVVIAPVGNSVALILNALDQYNLQEVVLVTDNSKMNTAMAASDELRKKGIPSQIKKIQGNLWEELFKIVNEVRKQSGENNVIVNVGTGDGMQKCVLISAAFVNGLKAVDTKPNGENVMLPILKFSYYKLLSPKKMDLLRLLHGTDCCESLEELSRATKMSLPLVSYHVNGNLKSQGLKELGLVDTHTVGGRTKITLSLLGKLLVQGLIDQPDE